MAGSKDHTLNRDAEIRKSKLDVFNQEHISTDFHGPVIDPITAAVWHGWGLTAHHEDALDEEAAGGSGAATAPRCDGTHCILETHGQDGDWIFALTEDIFDSRQMPELQARIRFGAGADDMTDSRIECGFYRQLATPRNSPVQYAAVVRETHRESNNFQLVVAGTEYRAFSLDDDAGAGAELTDETADMQEETADDVPIGVGAAAALDDGLIITNPRRFKSVVLVVTAVDGAPASTYITEYWNGTAWVAFTAPTVFDGTRVGRNVIDIPNVEYNLMGRLSAATNVIGNLDTVADAPGASILGHFAIRVKISVAAAGAPALVGWGSVEEWADIGVAAVENTYHDITLRIAGGGGGLVANDVPTTETSVQARVDDSGWATVGTGSLDISTGRDHHVAFKLQTLAAETKRLDIDAFAAFQARDGL